MKTEMIYRPLTATPFKHNSAYREVEPCGILQPYVRCFWGGAYDRSGTEANESSGIVIPDTCVDIIYRIDDVGSIITSDFVGVNDRAFRSGTTKKDGHKISVFAIRFYAWGAYAFCEDSFAGTINGRYDVRERFNWLDRELRSRLSEPGNLAERIRLAEELLVKKLENARENVIVDRIMNDILLHHGRLEISQLSKENFICGRQMERLFREYIGMAPKKLSNLVRYQCLWRDIVYKSHLNMMDAVQRYGYTDSSHLMREFVRYHSMNVRDALKMALR